MSITKKELQAQCTAANIAYTNKLNKAQLQALIDTNASTAVRKQRVSTKQILRNLFANVGDTYSVQHVTEHVQSIANVQAATIVTMLGDLKNTKYAAGKVIVITRNANNYTRES
jgi:hypothetical protein